MSAPVVIGPAHVPDLRTWLLQQWQPGHPYQVAAERHAYDPKGRKPSSMYAEWEARALAAATLWWVSEDMLDLLESVVPTVPDDVLVDQLPRPSNCGLVVLAKPYLGIDAATGERTVHVDGFCWGGTNLDSRYRGGTPTRCVSVSAYRHIDFDMGMGATEMQLAMATGAMGHATQVPVGHGETRDERTHVALGPDGQPIEMTVGVEPGPVARRSPQGYRLLGHTWVPLGRSDWPLEDELGTFDTGEAPLSGPTGPLPQGRFPHAEASSIEDRRLVAALWTLLHQEGIATTTTTVVERQARRRAERQGVAPDATRHVQVVTLRKLHRTRPDGEPEPHAGRYSHRWTVAGHWRNARVGPGRTQRRLTWVSPHIKGPDDTPLVVKERVNAWVR